MESGRKRKLREKEFTKEQLAHFKKLRKEQNKRRRKRKKCPAEEPAEKPAEELKVEEMTIAPPSPTAKTRHSNEEKRKPEEPGGKKMDRASLKRSEKNREESHPSRPANARHSDEKKRKLEKAGKKLPRGKQLVRASPQRNKKKMEKVQSHKRLRDRRCIRPRNLKRATA